MKDPIRKVLAPLFSSVLILLTIFWGMNGIINLFDEYEPPPPRQVGPPPAKESNVVVGDLLMRITEKPHWVRRLKEVGINATEASVYGPWNPWENDELWIDDCLPLHPDRIQLAKDKGMKVIFALRLPWAESFAEEELQWHGLYAPAPPGLLQSFLWEQCPIEKARVSAYQWKAMKGLIVGAELKAGEMP